MSMFCLAVEPDHRREGLARRLVDGLLKAPGNGELVYAQVQAGNTAAPALYQRVGLREAYRYRHRGAPRSLRSGA